jgi:tetratricopeptide (TPR) repeat protein
MKLKQSLNEIDLKAAEYYMRATRSQMYAGWLLKAFESYDRAANYVERSDRSDLRANLISVGTELATHTGIWADSLQEDGKYGSAWFWFEKIKEIDPEYPDIYQLVQSMEEKIVRRLKKSVGIFGFGSPSNAPDAGMIFANSLSAYLFKSADRDIKIFESEKLQSILDEMNLGHTGIVSPKTAEKIGSAYGIDVAVMGTILRYNVDYTNYSDTKTVTYQIKETEENIEYLNWKTRNPNPTKEQLEQAPPPYIHKLVDVEKEYRVSSHRKVAFVTVSFRIVEVETGESILIDTIRGSKIVTDDTSAGVQAAGVKYDPLEILTDTELLEALTEEVVTELGKKVLQPLQTLEQVYLETGEKHLQSKNRIAAAESFADAIFDTRLKQIKDSPIGAAALNSMVDLFSNYKFQTAG